MTEIDDRYMQDEGPKESSHSGIDMAESAIRRVGGYLHSGDVEEKEGKERRKRRKIIPC